jgi:hypothetical protein
MNTDEWCSSDRVSGRVADARLNDALKARRRIELGLINDWTYPNCVESHAPNVIETRCQSSPSSTAINIEGERERRDKRTCIVCGASETICQHLIYSAGGPFRRICCVAERDDRKEKKHEANAFNAHSLRSRFNKKRNKSIELLYVRCESVFCGTEGRIALHFILLLPHSNSIQLPCLSSIAHMIAAPKKETC